MFSAGPHAVLWERVSHLVTQQYVVFDSPIKECPTMDNVMVEVDVSVVFSIKDTVEDVYNFVFRLGATGLENMLIPFQQDAVRAMARQKEVETIYDLMDTRDADDALVDEKQNGDDGLDVSMHLENTKRQLNEKLSPYGVIVFSITITQVQIPEKFATNMESSTTFASKVKLENAKQKYNMRIIDDKESVDKAHQRLGEVKAEVIAEGQKKNAISEKQLHQYQADSRAIVADINEKLEADLLHIEQSSNLKIKQLNNEKMLILAEMDAGAKADVKTMRTKLEAECEVLRAQTKLKVAQNEALRIALEAEAEQYAASRLVAKRDFEAKMAHLRVVKNMALNKKLTVSGNSKDSVVAQLMAAKQAGAVLGLNV